MVTFFPQDQNELLIYSCRQQDAWLPASLFTPIVTQLIIKSLKIGFKLSHLYTFSRLGVSVLGLLNETETVLCKHGKLLASQKICRGTVISVLNWYIAVHVLRSPGNYLEPYQLNLKYRVYPEIILPMFWSKNKPVFSYEHSFRLEGTSGDL